MFVPTNRIWTPWSRFSGNVQADIEWNLVLFLGSLIIPGIDGKYKWSKWSKWSKFSCKMTRSSFISPSNSLSTKPASQNRKEGLPMKTTFEIPLDIPDVTIEQVESQEPGALTITVRSTIEETKCRKCGRRISKPHGHDEPITLRHLSILGRKTFIRIRPARYQCLHCKGNFQWTSREFKAVEQGLSFRSVLLTLKYQTTDRLSSLGRRSQ